MLSDIMGVTVRNAFWIVPLLFLFFANHAAAQCTTRSTIQVSPDAPAVGEAVTVTILGHYGHSCVSLQDSDCGEPVDQELVITLTHYDHEGDPEWGACEYLVEPWEFSCEYVFDAPGAYLIRLHEDWEPNGFCSEDELLVDVLSAVPAEASSWSVMKATFR